MEARLPVNSLKIKTIPHQSCTGNFRKHSKLLLKLPFSIPKSHVLPAGGHLVLEILNHRLGQQVRNPSLGIW